MKNQKGSFGLVAGIVMTLILLGGAYYWYSNITPTPNNNIEQQPIASKNTQSKQAVLKSSADSKNLFNLSYPDIYRIEKEDGDFTICLPGNNYDEYNAFIERDNVEEKTIPLINCLWYTRLSNGNPITRNLDEYADRIFKGDTFSYVGEEDVVYNKTQITKMTLGKNSFVKRISITNKGARHQINYLAMNAAMAPIEFTIETSSVNLDEVIKQVEKILESLVFLK